MRCTWAALCVVMATMVAGSVSAQGGDDPITAMLGELQWNMSKAELFESMAERIKQQYEPRIAEANGIIEEDHVYQQMREEIRRLRDNFFAFDGEVTGWDVSFIGPEFRHGSSEAMLVAQDDTARNFYFLIKNRFWKWYRSFEPGTFGNRSFDEIAVALEGRFGPGEWREREPGSDAPDARWVEWDFGHTRVRAVQRGQSFALVLESKQVLQQLARLRRNAKPRRKKDTSVVDSVLADSFDGERPTVKDDHYAGAAEKVIQELRAKKRREHREKETR